MLIVLVGARGAGKTTLLNKLNGYGVEVLQPSTTREPRFAGEKEYEFVKKWIPSNYAWSITISGQTYGMRISELSKAKNRPCVTVFEPMSLNEFELVRRTLGIETLTVGLSTIADLAEQHKRVANDQNRTMDEASFVRVAAIVSECDVVLTGDADTVANAMSSMLRLIGGRGGVVTKDHLVPMMQAGALLSNTDRANIRSASYDLRIGKEILFRGKVIELSDAQPRFEIPAYSYAVVSALEHASLPPFVVGRFDLKVSLFFEGVILSNGPQVDPGYKGALFCMLYNGSGEPKLLTFGKHFATIDFTTTTGITEGYRQKYQLKQRMGQFLTDSAVTGRGGAIVELVDDKIAAVDRKVKEIQLSFWAIAAAFITVGLLAPAIVVPVAWIEIGNLHTEKVALDDVQRQSQETLAAAAKERAAGENTRRQSEETLAAAAKELASTENAQRQSEEALAAAAKERAATQQLLEHAKVEIDRRSKIRQGRGG